MTIETIVCACGASLRIETDDPKFLEKTKKEWEREHKNCQHTNSISQPSIE